MVSGSAGIEIKSAHAVSIFDDGAIIGSGGTAIEFAGSGNTLTLGAGYTISGTVDPSGKQYLPARRERLRYVRPELDRGQYLGFTTFNVVGGTWTVTSASTAHWTIKSGALEVASGGELTSTTVSSGGVLVVESGGTASSSFVKAGGTEIIESGAVVSGVTISSGGTVELVGGTALPPGVQLSPGAILALGSAGFSAVSRQQRPHYQDPLRRHRSGRDVSGGGTLHRRRRRDRQRATILKGGVEIVSAGGTASDTNVSSGGALVVSSGGVADPTTIFSGGTETIRAGGTDDGARISSGGKLFIQSGGTAIDITIFSGGSADQFRPW